MVYIQGWQWRKHWQTEEKYSICNATLNHNKCMSVLKWIKKIRCFWKLFWNIKWNVELMSCVCVILKILVWSYRYQLMVGGTSSWSVQITSANQPTPVEYLRTLRLLREIPKWMIIPCGNMNMGRPSRNDQ